MSVITESLAVGVTRCDEGVPLGLINWMVRNREDTGICTVRIGKEVGYLWWIIKLRHIKMRWFIWNRTGTL